MHALLFALLVIIVFVAFLHIPIRHISSYWLCLCKSVFHTAHNILRTYMLAPFVIYFLLLLALPSFVALLVFLPCNLDTMCYGLLVYIVYRTYDIFFALFAPIYNFRLNRYNHQYDIALFP